MIREELTPSQKIKIETQTLHAQLEKTFIPKITAVKTTDDLIALLRVFYDFVAPLENLIGQFIPFDVLPDIAERQKQHLLKNVIDSTSLNGTSLSSIPLPHITSTCNALGAMYVLEGSTLGGKSIVRLLNHHKQQPFDISHLKYFNPYGEDTGIMWSRFQKVLNNHVENTNALQRIIASANATFNFITHHISTN